MRCSPNTAICKTDKALAFADRTLEGETDGYDGADGARKVSELCDYIDELIDFIYQIHSF
jgi:hypothetical protein